ncbi:hypothetical protein GCM10023080_027510 [Streptomyces pseudoechinosporeus]
MMSSPSMPAIFRAARARPEPVRGVRYKYVLLWKPRSKIRAEFARESRRTQALSVSSVRPVMRPAGSATCPSTPSSWTSGRPSRPHCAPPVRVAGPKVAVLSAVVVPWPSARR